MLIYNLRYLQLEIFKIYIRSNLANSFILYFKSHIIISILFIKKFDRNLYLYINYQSFNNLIIKIYTYY